MAWLAKTFKRPFRFIEDRREHLTAGANSREHHYEMVAYADRRGKLLALDARITIDGGACSGLAVHHRPGTGPGHRQPAGAVCVQGLSLRDQGGGHQQAGLRAVPGRGAHRRLLRHGADDGRDRPRGRARTLGNPPGEPGAGRTDALRQRHRQAPGRRRLSGQPAAGHGHDRRGRYPRAPAPGRADGRLIGVGLATYAEQAAHLGVRRLGHARHSGLRPGHGESRPMAGWSCGSACIRTGRGMETTFAQIASEILGVDVASIKLLHGDTGRRHFPPAPMPRARW